MEKKIVIACDHAGNEVKDALMTHFEKAGYTVTDFGCDGTCSVNYPDYAHYVCEALQKKEAPLGILVCGTGIGMSMAANKHKGIRAALCENEFSAEMTRRHNDANVICMGARVISVEKAIALADIFVNTEYEGGRHDARVAMLNALDDAKC
ncbi:MAG: ribose 5-phosphate isomerase B [Clostridia bacterium]|nr:ribose 5-phosphate isomerase B [Clostridia bacterium]